MALQFNKEADFWWCGEATLSKICFLILRL